jgi:hypothetical protein
MVRAIVARTVEPALAVREEEREGLIIPPDLLPHKGEVCMKSLNPRPEVVDFLTMPYDDLRNAEIVGEIEVDLSDGPLTRHPAHTPVVAPIRLTKFAVSKIFVRTKGKS